MNHSMLQESRPLPKTDLMLGAFRSPTTVESGTSRNPMARKLSPLRVSGMDAPNLGSPQASPRSPRENHPIKGNHAIQDFLAQSTGRSKTDAQGSRRNDILSKSMAAPSERSSGTRSVAFEVLGSKTGTKGRNGLAYTSIDMKDIVNAQNREKIGTTFVPSIQKPMSFTFQKDKGKHDFVNAI